MMIEETDMTTGTNTEETLETLTGIMVAIINTTNGMRMGSLFTTEIKVRGSDSVEDDEKGQ